MSNIYPSDDEEVMFPYGITTEEIVSKTRKLKANWTYEVAQDTMQWTNIAVEKELANLLAKEIQKEIDEEILADLREIKQYTKFGCGKKKIIVRTIDSDWEVSMFN